MLLQTNMLQWNRHLRFLCGAEDFNTTVRKASHEGYLKCMNECQMHKNLYQRTLNRRFHHINIKLDPIQGYLKRILHMRTLHNINLLSMCVCVSQNLNTAIPFFARRIRPSRWASCLREPPWEEIWMRTLASGRSNDVSATLLTNMVFTLGLNLKFCSIWILSFWRCEKYNHKHMA